MITIMFNAQDIEKSEACQALYFIVRISWLNATSNFILSIFEKSQIKAISRLKSIVINSSFFYKDNLSSIINFWIRSSIKQEFALILKNLKIKNKLYFSSNFCQEFFVIDNSSIFFQLRYLFEIKSSKSLVFTRLIFWAFCLYIVFIRTKSRKETYNCLKISNLRDKQIVETSFIIYNRNV